jgi:sn-glycerol 3-phosphate transport system substrate-binding protein
MTMVQSRDGGFTAMLERVRAVPLLVAALLFSMPASAATELQLWHSLEGANGLLISQLADTFNASQKTYRVITIFKGPYAETMSGGIAAYRAGGAPHMLQVFEVGNGTMAAAVGAVKPLTEVFATAQIEIGPDDFLPSIITNYLSRSGGMLSLPFNVSTMVTWFNRDRFVEAGLDPDRLPSTWPEVFEAARHIRRKRPGSCALSTAWSAWAHIEQLSAWHNQPIATRNNGLLGFDAELQFNRPLQVRHLENLASLRKDGAFEYNGRTTAGEAKFLSGECAIFLSSSALYGPVRQRASFDWAVRPMPYYPDEAGSPQNSLTGGGSLYVLQGMTDREYKGVGEFLKFLLAPSNQQLVYQNSGYLPVTQAAYDEVLRTGLYEQHPVLRVALQSVLYKPPTQNSSGLRLGNMLQMRDLWAEELEAALNGTKSPQAALDSAVSRGNRILRLFRQRTTGPLPSEGSDEAVQGHRPAQP